MEVSKVVYGERTLIDLTGDTVTALDLRPGITAHNAKGELITGDLSGLTLLEPLAVDLTHFWILSDATSYWGSCRYENATNCRITEYQLEIGKQYMFRFVEPYGTRSMVSYGLTTIIGQTETQAAIRLTPPTGYKGAIFFLAPWSGYLHMMTDNKSTDGLKTECYLMSD
ncbi:MAG: hypothetical protein IJG36_09320 [Synergistaceae bacterium]|nr:hypothetical protein [Synergistaceae bacterium]MBQ3759101.1 hypothetical protein [Synergistaceae bacterium]